MKHSRSLAVLGGGLAGAATVLSLVQNGINPTWIAPPNPTRDRVGESLSPAAHRTLQALGVADLLEQPHHRRSNSTFSAWRSDQLVERNSITHLEGSGWVVDRARFETDLLERASQSVEPRPDKVSAVERKGSAWQIVLDSGFALEADFVVDATGRSCLLGRQHAALHRADKQIAVWSLLEQTSDEVEPTRATLIEAVEDGWWYAALLPNGRMVAALFTDPDLVDRGVSRDEALWTAKLSEPQYIRRWIEEAHFAPTTPPTLASAGTTWLERSCGPGWVAVGDAAAAFDPLSSHGMTTALWSGHQAGMAIAKEKAGRIGELNRYAAAVAQGVETFLVQRKSFYGAERRFANAPYWQRRHSQTFDAVSGAIAAKV